MSRDSPIGRTAFTVLELVTALGALVAVAVVVAQLGVQSLAERQRSLERLAAIEAAANVLESARALPWERLGPEWAATVRLPEALAERLSESHLAVELQPVPDRPGMKRIDVAITWRHGSGIPARPVRLSALIARRAGGEPR